NEDRGYVLRRIIRRAVRFGYLLGREQDLATPLVEAVIDAMVDGYPELRADQDRITGVIAREEERFRQTLKRGSALLDAKLAELPEGAALGGDVAFDLYETYGFPLEVTQEITAELGIEVDEAGYRRSLAEAQERSKAGAKAGHDYANLTSFQEILDRYGPTEFVGREEYEAKATVLAVVPGEDGTASVFLDRTPFYAESGGQIGDTGTITTETGSVEVLDTTFALPNLRRHVARVVDGTVSAGQEATARIDVERRDATRRNHTATHLLHWALRRVLGDHVKQAGSYVGPDRLRFDFSHYEAVTPEQIDEIERLVNAETLRNERARAFETSKAEAEAMGAIAFFGDKYGDIVRVLEAGPSVELCGGTHVSATGDIGTVKVVSESSIGSNLRRIEAFTGAASVELLQRDERQLGRISQLVGSTGDVVDGVQRKLDEIKSLQVELKQLRAQLATGRAAELAASAQEGVVVERVDGVDPGDLRELAIAVRQQTGVRRVVLLGETPSGGVSLVAAVQPDEGIPAADLIKAAARAVGGGGGGKGDIATAGGKDPSGLDEAMRIAREAAIA
ncbi:MAG: alanine--tRNA ligase-related protein, partial [Acidimicrobiia bacterium]